MLCTLTMTLVLQCKSEVDHMRVAFRAETEEKLIWGVNEQQQLSSVFHQVLRSTPKLETNTHALFTIRWVLEIIKHHSATLANKRQCLLQVSLSFRPTKKLLLQCLDLMLSVARPHPVIQFTIHGVSNCTERTK